MLELKNVNKVYVNKGNVKVHALKNINIKFDQTGMTFIVGPSGGGKSTLLNVISGLDSFDTGTVALKGVNLKDLNGAALDCYRNTYGGFVFQELNLIDSLTLAENVELAVELQEQKPNKEEISAVFKKLGMAGMEKRYPNEISRGQRQRVALARVLVKKPSILFADEPSGSVDKATRKTIYNLLKSLSKEILVVAVTHSMEIAAQYADRIITIEDGMVVGDERCVQSDEASQMVGGEVLYIKPGKKLGLNEIDEINNSLAKKNKKGAYLCLTDSPRKASSAFPESMKALKKDVLANEKAKPAKKPEAKDDKPFELVKGKLPLKTSAKLAASNFGINKVRTAFTIILTTLAITFFILSSILTSFNGDKANIVSFLNSDAPYITIENQNAVFTENYVDEQGKQVDGDVAKFYKAAGIDATTNSLNYVHEFNGQILTSQSSRIDINKFIKWTPISKDQAFNSFGQRLVAGSWAVDDGEIVISSFAAKQIAYEGVSGVIDPQSSVASIIGKTVDVNGVDLKIVGVYEVEYEGLYTETADGYLIENTNLNQTSQNKLDYVKQNIFNVIYVNANFEDTIKIHELEFNNGGNKYISQLYISNKNESYNIVILPTDDISSDDILKVDYGTGLYYNTLKASIAEKLKTLALKTADGKVLFEKTFEVTEASLSNTTNKIYIAVSLDVYDQMSKAAISPIVQIVGSDVITKEEYLKINKLDSDLEFISYESQEIQEFANKFGVVGKGLLVTSVVLAVFAILMIYNFITQSVRSKYKNIGILRAIGARMIDIVGVFMLEACILTLSVVVASLVVSGIVTFALNIATIASVTYKLTVFTYSWTIFGIASAIVVAATFVSYLIPLASIAKTKPNEILKKSIEG